MRGVFIFQKRFINLILAATLGFAMGILMGLNLNEPTIKPVGEINPKVATLLITDLENGILKGKVTGAKARIAYAQSRIESLNPESSFSIPLNQITLGYFFGNESIPEGALWVASESGKNAYMIFDKRAYRIKPENRIYFASEEQAQKAGYKILPP